MLILSFDPFPELTTNRLLLRKVAASDVAELFFLRSDPDVLRYQDRHSVTSLDEVSAYIQHLHDLEARAEAVTWAISRSDAPPLIGTIGFWRFQKVHYRAEMLMC